MNQCPFLSTSKEKISCFKTCPFNKADEECPFRIFENKEVFPIDDYLDVEVEPALVEAFHKISW